MNNLSDNELVEIFINSKNDQAFAIIYQRYFDDVCAFVYSRVGNKVWTEDIVAETYITLLEIIPSFNKVSKLKSFIIGIAINKIRKFWYKSSKLREQSFDELFYINDLGEFDDEKEGALDGIIDQILPKLSEKYRSVLIERFINQKSIKNTAAILGLSEANVRVIQNRALKKASEIGFSILNNNKSL
jgi:RNA polymerase sigma-70 factor (ECF subfamily)